MCDSGVVSCCNNVLWILSIVWSRNYAYIILEALCILYLQFLTCPATRTSYVEQAELGESCPFMFSTWTGRHRQPVKCCKRIWTRKYLIFREDAFLTKPCYYFWTWVQNWICIFGCSALHTFTSALTNRSVTLQETLYSATELCLKFSSFHSSRLV